MTIQRVLYMAMRNCGFRVDMRPGDMWFRRLCAAMTAAGLLRCEQPVDPDKPKWVYRLTEEGLKELQRMSASRTNNISMRRLCEMRDERAKRNGRRATETANGRRLRQGKRR